MFKSFHFFALSSGSPAMPVGRPRARAAGQTRPSAHLAWGLAVRDAATSMLLRVAQITIEKEAS